MYLALLLASFAVTRGQQNEAVRCVADAGRRAEELSGAVTRGATFDTTTAGGWIVRLHPIERGWEIEVTQKGREDENLARLTPPWHFVPNPRWLEGWHFRNADNTGPNDGSVNAPQEIRQFVFSPDVGRGIEYNGSAQSPDDVGRVERFGRGWLRVDQFELSPPRRGERAVLESLRFTVCLTVPAGPALPRGR